MFFYPTPTIDPHPTVTVSVPRRGFIVFLLNKDGTTVAIHYLFVSVPRRGFIVFLHDLAALELLDDYAFQSPEGDSLFFYVLARAAAR